MDLRRSAIYLLGVVLCWNAASTILLAMGITATGPSGYGSSLSNLDAKTTIANYQWNSFVFNDFVTGVLAVINLMWDLILGAPTLLLSSGVPAFIVTPLIGIWVWMWFMVVMLNWIGGRET